MDETILSLFGSLFCPDWRESQAQLTEKQVVLLMHDTLPQGVKSVHALLQKKQAITISTLRSYKNQLH